MFSSSVGREAGAGSVVGKLGLSGRGTIYGQREQALKETQRARQRTYSNCLARPSSVK